LLSLLFSISFSCEWVDVDIESVVNAVELHCLARRRGDDVWMPQYRCRMTADGISAIECPDFG